MARYTQTLRPHARASSVSKKPSPTASSDGWAVRCYRDEMTEEHLLHFEFPCIGDRKGSATLPRSMGASTSRLASELSGKGAALPHDKRACEAWLSSLIKALPRRIGTLAGATGWHGRSFLLGPELIGASDVPVILRPTVSQQGGWLSGKTGNFEDWRSRVAKPAAGSSYASFAIMHALAAPLYKFAGLPEGAIFNFSAPSSVGKTTALKVGASVSGDPNILTDWNATLRGLQERAAAHSGLQLILDDTETIRPHERDVLQTLLSVTHKLTSGTSTDYAESVQATQRPLHWTCWAISTSPRGIDSAFEAAGRPRSESDRVRLIDIPVRKATGGGIWDRCSSADVPMAERSERLGKACQANYGYPLREWLEYVVDHQDDMGDEIQRHIQRFVAKLCPHAGGVERRIARKFGLIYAAGRIATDQGLLPWDESHALKVAGKLFRRARNASNGGRVQVDLLLKGLAEVQASRYPAFTKGTMPSFATDKALKGYRVRDWDVERLCIRLEALETLYHTDIASVLLRLKEIGAMESGQDGRSAKQRWVKVAGRMQKARMLVINLDRLRAMTGSIKAG